MNKQRGEADLIRRAAERLKKKAQGTANRVNHIIPEAWDFTRCPHPEQTEVCYLYEYSWQSDAVRKAVEETRARLEVSRVQQEAMLKWVRRRPKPVEKEAYEEWIHQLQKRFPNAVLTSRLSGALMFLVECEHFPGKHWMEIKGDYPTQLAQRYQPERERWGVEPFEQSKRRMVIRPLEEFIEDRTSFSGFKLRHIPFPPDYCGYHVFYFNWMRSNRMLLIDFAAWLEANRPIDQQSYETTAASTSRITSYKDHLKALAALRLLQSFGGNVSEARFHSINADDKPLYGDQSTWLRAKKNAETELREFEKRMIKIEKTFG